MIFTVNDIREIYNDNNNSISYNISSKNNNNINEIKYEEIDTIINKFDNNNLNKKDIIEENDDIKNFKFKLGYNNNLNYNINSNSNMLYQTKYKNYSKINKDNLMFSNSHNNLIFNKNKREIENINEPEINFNSKSNDNISSLNRLDNNNDNTIKNWCYSPKKVLKYK